MNQSLNMERNKAGYWGKHTTSMNWCEPDYQHSYYIAETFNTISNSFYIIGSLLFFIQVKSLYSNLSNQSPMRLYRWYPLMVCGTVLGIGSWMFHMTLLQEFQMMDELSMLVGMLCMLYCCLTFDDYKEGALDQQRIQELPNGAEKTRQEAYYVVMTAFGYFGSLKAMLSAVTLVITFAVLLLVYDPREPLVFQALFGILSFTMLFMSIKRSHLYSRRYLQLIKSLNDENKTAHMIDQVKQRMVDKRRLLYYAVASMILAIIVWNTDNLTCPTLEYLKLHSLWHLFTAAACYYFGGLFLIAYYGDRFDEWQYEMAKTTTTNNNGKESRPVWIHPNEQPMNVKLTWKFGLFPFVEQKLMTTSDLVDREQESKKNK